MERYRINQKKLSAGITIKAKGRPRKDGAGLPPSVQQLSKLTQLPYALTVAGISFVCYIVSGFVTNWYITLPLGAVLTVATLFVLKAINSKKA